MLKIYLAETEPLLEESFYREALAIVSADRRKRIPEMRNFPDRARSIAAGLLLNYAVGRNTGIAWNGECLYGRYGKPMLPLEYGLYFNLSHSGNFAVCAVSDHEIGVDIQEHKKYRNNLANRFFHPEELAYLKEAADEEQCFYDLWTMKESCMKCVGRGLGMGMDSFSVMPLVGRETMRLGQTLFTGEWNPAYFRTDLRELIKHPPGGDLTGREDDADCRERLEGYSLAVLTEA